MLFALLLAGSILLLWLCRHGRLDLWRLPAAIALLMSLNMTTFAAYHDTALADPMSGIFQVAPGLQVTTLARWQVRDRDQVTKWLAAQPDSGPAWGGGILGNNDFVEMVPMVEAVGIRVLVRCFCPPEIVLHTLRG